MSQPWWSQYKKDFVQAMQYFTGMKQRLEEDQRIQQFFAEREVEGITKFIFESNTIEKEGPSEQETNRILVDHSHLLQLKYAGLLQVSRVEDLKVLYQNSGEHLVTAVYRGQEKNAQLVINHLLAVAFADILTYGFIRNRAAAVVRQIEKLHSAEIQTQADLAEYKQRIGMIQGFDFAHDFDLIFTEEHLKLIHKVLSYGLDNNNNGEPGEYRPGGAYIDLRTQFPAPELVPIAMKKSVEESNERYHNKQLYNPFLEACKVSGDLIKIHPFGDFNGRTARIFLNMILRGEGLPFFLILRSDAKSRKKYLTAMKHYFKNGRLDSYIAFICKTFLCQIEELNQDLIGLGIEPMVQAEYSEGEKEDLHQRLAEYVKLARFDGSGIGLY